MKPRRFDLGSPTMIWCFLCASCSVLASPLATVEASPRPDPAPAVQESSPSSDRRDSDAAWSEVEALRDALVDYASVFDFVQTFIPTGFDSGERETGTLSLELPDRLRWDYELPYSRSFLLVEDTVYAWNAGEASGRRTPLHGEELQHLDMVRLRVELLRQRYGATVRSVDGLTEVRLTPLEEGGRIVEATLQFDLQRGHFESLQYRDIEGNRTEFLFSGRRPVGDSTRFQPPGDLDWIEE